MSSFPNKYIAKNTIKKIHQKKKFVQKCYTSQVFFQLSRKSMRAYTVLCPLVSHAHNKTKKEGRWTNRSSKLVRRRSRLENRFCLPHEHTLAEPNENNFTLDNTLHKVLGTEFLKNIFNKTRKPLLWFPTLSSVDMGICRCWMKMQQKHPTWFFFLCSGLTTHVVKRGRQKVCTKFNLTSLRTFSFSVHVVYFRISSYLNHVFDIILFVTIGSNA